MRQLLVRFKDWYLGLLRESRIAERDCRHDGSEPMCFDCIRQDW